MLILHVCLSAHITACNRPIFLSIIFADVLYVYLCLSPVFLCVPTPACNMHYKIGSPCFGTLAHQLFHAWLIRRPLCIVLPGDKAKSGTYKREICSHNKHGKMDVSAISVGLCFFFCQSQWCVNPFRDSYRAIHFLTNISTRNEVVLDNCPWCTLSFAKANGPSKGLLQWRYVI